MRKRLTLLSILITTIAILLFSVASTLIYYNNSIQQAKADLAEYAERYGYSYTLDQDGCDSYSANISGSRVTLLALDGTVIADSHYDSADMDNHLYREEVQLALTEGYGYAVRYSDTLETRLVYYCISYDTYLVRIAVTTASIMEIYISNMWALGFVLVIDILICLLLVWLSMTYILHPVHELAEDAHCGKFCTQYTELQPLATQMRNMHYNIKQQIVQLNQEKETIQQIQHSKSEFISNVTHEMNTPLTSIKGYSEWLVSGQLTPEQVRNSSAIIADQADRLSNLIKCIIDYNQIDNDDVDTYEVNISAVTQTIITTLLPSIKNNNLTVTTHIDDNVIVQSRQERVHQVIGNLIRNAIKYNVPNGTIDITVAGGKDARIVVSDTGIGIAEENKPKVFSRFFTVDKSHGGQNGGFGLGLAVVKKICNIHGWTITLDSTLGQGTTFTVLLNPEQ